MTRASNLKTFYVTVKGRPHWLHIASLVPFQKTHVRKNSNMYFPFLCKSNSTCKVHQMSWQHHKTVIVSVCVNAYVERICDLWNLRVHYSCGVSEISLELRVQYSHVTVWKGYLVARVQDFLSLTTFLGYFQANRIRCDHMWLLVP